MAQADTTPTLDLCFATIANGNEVDLSPHSLRRPILLLSAPCEQASEGVASSKLAAARTEQALKVLWATSLVACLVRACVVAY